MHDMEMAPQDPAMLLSWVNLKLRDFYPNLEEMCTSLNLEKKELEERLAAIDYHYDQARNQFV